MISSWLHVVLLYGVCCMRCVVVVDDGIVVGTAASVVGVDVGRCVCVGVVNVTVGWCDVDVGRVDGVCDDDVVVV